MSRPLKLILVAVLFALAGILSELLMGTALTKTFLDVAPGVLPFAILAAALCVRPPLRTPIAGILICAVWAGAFWLAVALDHALPSVNMLVAGLAGGLGVALATAIGCRKLIRVRSLLSLTLAGAIGAIPFQWPFTQNDVNMVVAFAIWQAVVGTLLYVLSER